MHELADRASAAVAGACLASAVARQGQLNIVCSVPIPWCEALIAQFQKDTGIKVGMTRRIRRGDGAGRRGEGQPQVRPLVRGHRRSHLQAAELGLTDEYRSPMLPQLYDWAVRQAEQSKYNTVGIYTGALGIGYNPELLAKKKLPPPKCWADLANPIYRDEVQMANPNASGTAYSTLATFVQIFGEDKAFELMKGMHKNTNNYPRTGAGAIRAVGARRDDDRRRLPARRRDGDRQRLSGEDRRAVRRHRLRSRLDEHRQGRDEPRQREEVLRLGAVAGGAEDRRPTLKNFQTPSNKATPIPAGCAEERRTQAHRLRLREIRQRRGAQAHSREVGQECMRSA